MLTRWTDLDKSFAVFNELQRRMNQLFDAYEPAGWRLPPAVAQAWPAVNLFDAGEALILQAQVPGLSEKDITITLNQDVLTLSGERNSLIPSGYSVHRQERGNVKFSRCFTFPCQVDPEKTTASVKEGILTIILGKAAEARPRQITVEAQ